MCDLEKVDVREAISQERRVDSFLDVAHEQGAAFADAPQQHDRDVVDARTAVGRRHRHLATDRPQDLQVDLVDRQPVAGSKPHPDWRAGSREVAQPGHVARSRTAHARLEDPPNLVSLEQQREACDVVLVRVTEDDGIDPSIPRRQPPIQLDEKAVGVRTAVDQEPPAV
jgi:hypothetical protein